MQPLCQKWGYPERILNLLEPHLGQISGNFEGVDRLITIPLPLAYLQHCKVMFLTFVMVYPLTIETSYGIWANIFSPCCLFIALLGFEVLADEMENPVGDDSMDLNVMRMIHDLEGRCSEIFTISQVLRPALFDDLTLAMDDMGMDIVGGRRKTTIERETSVSFKYHFTWLPLPVHILAYCGDQEQGVGKQLLEAAGLGEAGYITRSCWRIFCCIQGHKPGNTSDDDDDDVVEKVAQRYNLITQFMVLKPRTEAVCAACEEQVKHYLGNSLANPVSVKASSLNFQQIRSNRVTQQSAPLSLG